jgi:hypothetical protein
MTETVTVKLEGMTMSALLARHYRQVFSGIVAKTFAINQDNGKPELDVCGYYF